ncbi:MAG: NAD(P)H-dependent glycerol-3-phosphate dehydrogenase [Pseudomonadota bacterium]|nr:NAD(P)H-dependent glycerol-3-phosphate dehydrogenase [Pseudomonadota bacterium]
MSISRISVLGAGAWGSALAHMLAEMGHEVILWGRNPEVIDQINTHQNNLPYLGNLKLNANINATTDLKATCLSDIYLLVVPVNSIQEIAKEIAFLIPSEAKIVCCAKGFEQSTGNLLSKELSKIFPEKNLAYLSGPTFANEVVKGLPSAATLATIDISVSQLLAEELSNKTFRIYSSTDIVGVQVGGAVKNVLAIASGMARGSGFGENSIAALITRGLSEMRRLAQAMGGSPKTLVGLSGLGDVLLSCSSRQSRNFLFGELIGKGNEKRAALKKIGGVVEGWFSTASVIKKQRELKIDLPICKTVYGILHNDDDIKKSVAELLKRPIRPE